MENRIQATVSKRKLRLIPDLAADPDLKSGNEHEFDVVVINASRYFTSFQLELLAPGLDSQAGGDWYSIEPEICAKKPPGAQTQFHVVIKKPPIPAYDTTLDLTLRIFSVEYATLFTSQPISLLVEKPRRSLRIFLPNKDLKVFPGDEIEIPVILYNLDSKSNAVIVSLTGLEPGWMTGSRDIASIEQELTIEAGDSLKTSFYCRPPHYTALSQPYPFTVEVKSPANYYSAREQGVLEVLPQGAVTFECQPEVQTIAAKGLRKAVGTAIYELRFENRSNQPQEIAIAPSEGPHPFIPPPPLRLHPGEVQQAPLVVQRRRPWLGWPRRVLFPVTPELTPMHSDSSMTAVQLQPNSKTLELRIPPLIPPLAQLGSALLFLLLLWMLWLLRSDGHHSTVNFVRFSGDGTTVLSGSSDETVRRWFVNRTMWQPDRLLHWQWQAQRLIQPDNIGENIGKAVRVIRHGRKNNLVAVGLEDGTIQLWDTAFTKPQQTLYQGTDRVFDLVFTQDSNLLFSGHGSGMVRRWSVVPSQTAGRQIRTSLGEMFPATAKEPQRTYFPFAVSSLALSEFDQAPPWLVVAGQFNQLVLWDWNANRLYNVPYHWETPPYAFSQPIMGKEQAIASVATAQNLLATADNQGYITLWDMTKRPCQLQGDAEGICNLPILDQWRDGHSKQPVRSVALTSDGCYMASTGDDGRVMLWPLENGKRSEHERNGVRLADFPIRLNSVDITQKDNTLVITSDGDRDRVMLYRIHTRNDAKDENHATCHTPTIY
ncbi:MULTISPECIES: WD40 repeat domain-containing protein [unclassified Leptolyngbya]|uniref:WD40 repeat domain-containing protein n=1 Tax=unclassified Leptolyngbya TaxID=2650499 RepID=UPI001688274B|nr:MULTISPECIES: WD40 repeat domain-containing protein [unclassified Leptolyngbya]MBD1909341.1 WD40 repeat domain-containing protein [Leptolyngbya sp. FACHB-8]MBD2158199.1 WD40 repeat domain-containing protein [Leptolyngbya sp. FACHB-16]